MTPAANWSPLFSPHGSFTVFDRWKTGATRCCTSCGHIAVMIGRNTSISVSTDNSRKKITVHVDNFQSSEFNARYVLHHDTILSIRRSLQIFTIFLVVGMHDALVYFTKKQHFFFLSFRPNEHINVLQNVIIINTWCFLLPI